MCRFQYADYQLMIIICTNVAWFLLTLRSYLEFLDYNISPYIRIPFDIVVIGLFNYFCYKLGLSPSRNKSVVWNMMTQFCQCIAYRATYCCRSKSDYAIALEKNFQYEHNKCSICWNHYDAQSAQSLLHCGHRYHQYCLDKYESSDGRFGHQCPQCRTMYNRYSKWKYQYAYHLLHFWRKYKFQFMIQTTRCCSTSFRMKARTSYRRLYLDWSSGFLCFDIQNYWNILCLCCKTYGELYHNWRVISVSLFLPRIDVRTRGIIVPTPSPFDFVCILYH